MFICEVNKNNLNVRTRELLTSGSRRVNTVEFRFNSDWTGLSKTATFRTKKKTVSVRLDDTNICMIPWEVLSDAEESLAVGVFGVDGETLILPTVWGILGKVADAAEMGDSEKEPTPNVYQQILDELNSLENPTWENVGDKPFEKIGDGLSVENGVLSVHGGSGGTPNAVQYVEQTLTDEQKAQARENIGAGTSSFSGSYNDLADKPTIPEGYTLPVATSDVLGGVKPAAKTDAMTSAVGVDADGKLWSAAGGGEWETITEITLTEAVNNVVINKDSNGNDFALKRVKVECVIQCNTEDTFTSIKTRLNGFTSSSNATLSGTQPVRYYSFYAELIPGSGALAWHNVSYNNYNWRSELQQMGYKYNDLWMQSSITSLTISPNDGGKNLGLAGTTIKVLGVRA